MSITIQFKNGQMGGHSGCNAYGGMYQPSNGGSISFGSLSVTAMACREPVMALESAYLNALGKITRFSVDRVLELKGPDIVLKYTQQAAVSSTPSKSQ